MVILTLTYKKPLDEVEKHLAAHRAFLDNFYAKGKIITSGPREPRIGGVIICNLNTIAEANELILCDPFFQHEIADYTITLFHATKHNTLNFESAQE